jgi:hypothetical protein
VGSLAGSEFRLVDSLLMDAVNDVSTLSGTLNDVLGMVPSLTQDTLGSTMGNLGDAIRNTTQTLSNVTNLLGNFDFLEGILSNDSGTEMQVIDQLIAFLAMELQGISSSATGLLGEI